MAITAWAAKVSSKLDLLFAERTDFLAANIDRADGDPFAKQRRYQELFELPLRSREFAPPEISFSTAIRS